MPNSKILIVEDEGIIAMDIRRQLEDFGYEVVATAFSGGQAITLAEQSQPDLVLMDIVLKGEMDGISAAHAISETLRIPVIFLTAYSDPDTLRRAQATGAYGYLIKPFRPDELHASIEVALYKRQLEQKLKDSEQWFAKTLHCISDAVIATDGAGNIRFMNPVAEAAIGLDLEHAKGTSVEQLMTLLNQSNRAVMENPVPKTLKSRQVTSMDCATLLVNQSGHEFPVEDGAAPILDDDGSLLGAVMVFRDISERRRMEKLLRESEERFHSAFDLASIGMALIALDGGFLQVNNSLMDIFGYSKPELLQANLQMLTHAENTDNAMALRLRQLLADELPSFQIEIECYHKIVGKVVWALLSGSLVRNSDGEPQYFILQIQDITNRKFAEQQLLYLANHDPLTGLLNREQFHNRLTKALAAVQRYDTKLALMYLDLDRFKLINDTLGHRLGDLLLQSVSDRLRTSIRAQDILARLGGDEFIILLSDINKIDDAARVAEKTIDMLTQSYTLEGNNIVVTASIGISIYPDDGKDSHTLLMNADAAMYLAKERGKNNYQFYTLAMTERSLERMTIERGLRRALANNELRVHYQPQIDLASGLATCVEALVRWQHPEWGLVYPDRFIGVAEETGLIVPIGAWVLSTACKQVKSWHEHDGPFSAVAVNLSARQFLENNLYQTVKQTLVETGLNPSALELEITESAVMQDPENTLKVLQQLRELGVTLSIDDFGTGYSSLTYLRRFPVQSVKIDQTFVADISNDEGCRTLVSAIIALTHELKLNVIAEGVETEEQLAFLSKQRCDSLQGYIFSRPETSATLENEFKATQFKTQLHRYN
ncbi:diguanylate cyclase/phosphodiesterase (GGDEF & EAL domains) with PAS/PAC sensor(s) [Methylomonas albis]|uniref:EAL domain-containing protein n=1 Tax=Methylomonas albis TaxID=1854563 RepID=A0ABR9D093_9GAMM|nr:GGDEF domain-containing response regulator [Methylomonas albis]MBD9356518.1 EAL domain-containing protein [Methylomonas albis]CAD6879633.1 diguanylate cyclase/phosphodiesterase (GGDEF & EAL domains) with PAS/PAC sensor(s) [Methylomonas albis]